MKIDAIELELPTRIVTNEEVLDLIKHKSKHSFQGDLKNTLNKIKLLLIKSGLKQRHWLNNNEKPIDLLGRSLERALTNANCTKSEIDLLIYVGIGRGFIEPGGSYLVAHKFGLNNAHCFDVIDACMSWSRALLIIHSFLKQGIYKRVAIVNAEFNMINGGPLFPKNYVLLNEEQVLYTFPSYTIGEAATVTILSSNTENDSWHFNFSTRPDLADLCTVPTAGFKMFCAESEKIGRNGTGNFTSYGMDLCKEGVPEAIKIFKQLPSSLNIDYVFTHASSKKEWEIGAEQLGIKELVHFIYPKMGNLVSASIPAGIADSYRRGKLKRGNQVVCWVGSAGMSFAAYSFIF